MTNKPVVFPQYLDNAQQILMFEADDLMPILGGLAIAAIMNMWARESGAELTGLVLAWVWRSPVFISVPSAMR